MLDESQVDIVPSWSVVENLPKEMQVSMPFEVTFYLQCLVKN